MLVQVELQGKVKWVRVPTNDDRFDYRRFIEESKFKLYPYRHSYRFARGVFAINMVA